MSGSEERSFASYNIDYSEKTRVIAALIILLLCVVVFAGLCIYQYFRFAKYETIDISGIPLADSAEYCWKLENNSEKDGYYLLSGWIVKMGESIRTYSINIIIEKEDGTAFLVPVEMIERKDVSEKLNGELQAFDYSASGFSVAINSRYAYPGENILVLYRNNGRNELVDISATL